jgi:DNA invertase Pin-like site-specific DNA recombinase
LAGYDPRPPGEGRERAKANGVKMGPKFKLTDHQKHEAIKRRDHGEETLAEIGRSYNVSGWTIARLALRKPQRRPKIFPL